MTVVTWEKTSHEKGLEESLGSSSCAIGALFLSCHRGSRLERMAAVSWVWGLVGALAEVLTEPGDDGCGVSQFVGSAAMWLR
jgi:hypothetical protein